MSHSPDSSSSSSSSSSSDSETESPIQQKKRMNINDPSTYDEETLALYQRLQSTLPSHLPTDQKRSAAIVRKARTHSRSKTEFTYGNSNSSNIHSIDTDKQYDDKRQQSQSSSAIHTQPTDTEHSDTSKNSTAAHTRNSSNDSELSTLHYIESQPVQHSYHNMSDSSEHSYDTASHSNNTTPEHSPHPDGLKRSLHVGRFEVSDDNNTPQMSPHTKSHHDIPEMHLSTELSKTGSTGKLDAIDESTEASHQFIVPELPTLMEGETSDELTMSITALPDISVSITPTGKGLEFTPCTMKFRKDADTMSCKFRVTATPDCKPGDICVKYVVCGSSAEDYAVPHRDVLHLRCSDTSEHDHTDDSGSVHSDHSHTHNHNNNAHNNNQTTDTLKRSPQPTERVHYFTKQAVPQQSGRFTIVDEIDTDDIHVDDNIQHMSPTTSNNNLSNSSLYIAAQATTNVALALADHVNKTFTTDNTIYATSNSHIQLPNGANASIQAQISKTSNYLTPRALNSGGSPASSRSASPASDSNSTEISPRNAEINNTARSISSNTSNVQHSTTCNCVDCIQHAGSRNSSVYSNSSQTVGAELFGMLEPIQMMAMLQDRFQQLQLNNNKLLDENTQLKAELQQLREFKQKHTTCTPIEVVDETRSLSSPLLTRSITTPSTTDHSKASSSATANKSNTFQTNIQPLNKSTITSSSNKPTAQTTSSSTKPVTISPPSSSTNKQISHTMPSKSSSRATNSTLNQAVFHTNSNSVTMTQTTTSLQLNGKTGTNDKLGQVTIDKHKPLTSTTTTTTTTIPLNQISSGTSDLLEQLSNKCITSLTQQHSKSAVQSPSTTTKQLNEDKHTVDRAKSLDT